MTPQSSGLFAVLGATVIWGLSPLYYKMLTQLGPAEVLAHRTLWSFVFFGAVLALQRRLRELPGLIARAWRVILLAAIMISCNWFGFIYAVQVGRAVEASLGYFTFPLVAVVIGAVVFKERLNHWQWAAVALAVSAVCLLTYGLHVVPALSLLLAGTFGVYGLLKKQLDAGPVLSVTAEVLLLVPLALGWMGYLYIGQGHPTPDLPTLGLLALSGPLTAGPLILFSFGSRRVRMATLGLAQYLNPTLQFFCAVAIFREPLTGWHTAAFAMIWTGLALYSWQSLSQQKAARAPQI